MRHYATHRERTERAMDAYMNLIDTAEWLKGELRTPLNFFPNAVRPTTPICLPSRFSSETCCRAIGNW
jgi:hypothetical protein